MSICGKIRPYFNTIVPHSKTIRVESTWPNQCKLERVLGQFSL